MADDGSELSTRGNEWEVVSLTASTYAAAPGDRQVDPPPAKDEDLARAMFLSRHFVFPPSEHENLPIQPDISEIYKEAGGEKDIDHIEASGEEPHIEDEDKPAKSQEEWNIKGLSESDDGHGVPFFSEKLHRIPSCSTELEEGKVLQGLGLLATEENVYHATHFRSLCDEAESSVMLEHEEHAEKNIDSGAHFSQSPKSSKADETGEAGVPGEIWWKKHMASLYAYAKETNTLWSVVFAAALMGLVILGQRWQRERWQLQQLRWHFGINNENMDRLLGPMSRLKGALGGGQRRISDAHRSISAER